MPVRNKTGTVHISLELHCNVKQGVQTLWNWGGFYCFL